MAVWRHLRKLGHQRVALLLHELGHRRAAIARPVEILRPDRFNWPRCVADAGGHPSVIFRPWIDWRVELKQRAVDCAGAVEDLAHLALDQTRGDKRPTRGGWVAADIEEMVQSDRIIRI